MELAGSIAQRNPVAVAGAKRAILAGIHGGVDYGLRVEAAAVGECCGTVAQQTAAKEFLARRRK